MEIRNPRRILCVGPRDSGVLAVLKAITGSSPAPKILRDSEARTHLPDPDVDSSKDEPQQAATSRGTASAPLETTAGLTHSLALVTKYYSVTIPIWLDEVSVEPVPPASPSSSASSTPASSSSTPSQKLPLQTTGIPAWKSDFLSPSAAEVTDSLGAWVVVFRKHGTAQYKQGIEALLVAVEEIVEQQGAGIWEGGMFAVSMPGPGLVTSSEFTASAVDSTAGARSEDEHWEAVCLDHGFEYIDGTVNADDGAKRDAMGEVHGLARLKEALEACDWTGTEGGDDEAGGLGLLDADDELDGFGELVGPEEAGLSGLDTETAQMDNEAAGFGSESRRGLMADDDEDEEGEAKQVEELERMMAKMQAARDMSAHLPEEQRKRFAAKTVNDILRLG